MPGYFVVFKLDKPQTIQFKPHWDARRAMGEKDDEGNIMADTVREQIPVTASQLKSLAPPGEDAPVKVSVDPLGRTRHQRPIARRNDNPATIDPRIMEIAKEACAARMTRGDGNASGKSVLPGSWKWMRKRLASNNLEHLGAQLSAAMRQIGN